MDSLNSPSFFPAAIFLLIIKLLACLVFQLTVPFMPWAQLNKKAFQNKTDTHRDMQLMSSYKVLSQILLTWLRLH